MQDSGKHVIEFILFSKDKGNLLQKVHLNLETNASIEKSIEFAKSKKSQQLMQNTILLNPQLITNLGEEVKDFDLNSLIPYKLYLNCTIASKNKCSHEVSITHIPSLHGENKIIIKNEIIKKLKDISSPNVKIKFTVNSSNGKTYEFNDNINLSSELFKSYEKDPSDRNFEKIFILNNSTVTSFFKYSKEKIDENSIVILSIEKIANKMKIK